LGLYHSIENDSVMTTFREHWFSTTNKNNILSESDKSFIQQLYSKPTTPEPKTVEVRAVYNLKKL